MNKRSTAIVREGEYQARGDYHRVPDDRWDYYPTYLAKLRFARAFLDRRVAHGPMLDVGCGEGVLVEEYRARGADIVGIDAHYASAHVTRGSATRLPYPDETFSTVLCLDVLEHLAYTDQPRALAEIARVLRRDGVVLFSIPNLAHLQSRVHFALRGRLMRTAGELKHVGDRPIREYLSLLAVAGFEIIERRGLFPTIPVLTHFIRRHPRGTRWLYSLLNTVAARPGWCFLNLLVARKAPGSQVTC